MNRIRNIQLQYENCEVLTIPAEYFLVFSCGEIKSSIDRIATNVISKVNFVDKLVFIVDNKFIGNKTTKDESFTFESLSGTKAYDYLKNRKDITHINVVYEDNTEDYIEIPWLGYSDYYNEAQENLENSTEDILTHIYKDEKSWDEDKDELLEFFFSKESINAVKQTVVKTPED